MRTPLVCLPIKPILDDVIDGNITRTKSFEDVETLLLRFVTLAALPKAKSPARHHRRLAANTAIAGDYLIDLGSINKVVVNTIADFGPERSVCARGRRLPEELHGFFALISGPLKLHTVTMLRFKMDLGHLFPRQPTLAPVVDDELIVKPKLDAAVRIGLEKVVAADRSFNSSLPSDADVAGRRQVGMNSRVRVFLSIRRSNVDLLIDPRGNLTIEVRSGIIGA